MASNLRTAVPIPRALPPAHPQIEEAELTNKLISRIPVSKLTSAHLSSSVVHLKKETQAIEQQTRHICSTVPISLFAFFISHSVCCLVFTLQIIRGKKKHVQLNSVKSREIELRRSIQIASTHSLERKGDELGDDPPSGAG